MKFTEAQLEQAFIELLEQKDIPHIHGNTIARELDEVLIKVDLQSFLLDQYKDEGPRRWRSLAAGAHNSE